MMNTTLFIVSVVAILITLDGYTSVLLEPRVLYATDSNRVRGFSLQENADLVLGGFFAVHDPSSDGKCGTRLDD